MEEEVGKLGEEGARNVKSTNNASSNPCQSHKTLFTLTLHAPLARGAVPLLNIPESSIPIHLYLYPDAPKNV